MGKLKPPSSTHVQLHQQCTYDGVEIQWYGVRLTNDKLQLQFPAVPLPHNNLPLLHNNLQQVVHVSVPSASDVINICRQCRDKYICNLTILIK